MCHPQKNDRPASKLVKYMIDIAMAMNYVSGKGLVHRVSYNLLRETDYCSFNVKLSINRILQQEMF